tara:strand:+ start:1544 stop:1720 length:177 start_codon:yes stop_codon:yes gene_type:complete
MIKEIKDYIKGEIVKWEEVKTQCLEDLHHCSEHSVSLLLLKATCYLDVLREIDEKLKI